MQSTTCMQCPTTTEVSEELGDAPPCMLVCLYGCVQGAATMAGHAQRTTPRSAHPLLSGCPTLCPAGRGGGHYTAYCRMPEGLGDGRWYTFDDSHVSEMAEGGVNTSSAYVLFYRRQGSLVDVEALLERHQQQQEQQAAAAAAAAGDEQPLGVPGGGGSSTLGKRQPDTIEEEEEDDMEPLDSRDDIPAAGAIEID